MIFVLLLLIALGLVLIPKRMGAAPGVALGLRAAALVPAIIGLLQCIAVVPAGHVGVIDTFGQVSNRTLSSGINLVNPFADVINFSIKTQELKEQTSVPSREGLTVGLEVSLLYSIDPTKAADLYRTVGENYLAVVVVPKFRSVLRGVTASYDAKALYTSEREVLADKIRTSLAQQVNKRGIIVEDTPLRQVDLPAKLTDAIEEKLKAEQESQRMAFTLQREKQEAERKRIEAQGISDFQTTVSQGIDQNLLRWKGIEATENLAKSPNAKIVVIGSGEDGLPLILNQ